MLFAVNVNLNLSIIIIIIVVVVVVVVVVVELMVILIIGFTCPDRPSISSLSQSATSLSHSTMRYYKVRRLLQSATEHGKHAACNHGVIDARGR